MKRCFFIFLLILCLLPGLAGAEEEDALYPIRENGLWGYMNRTGETVIAPQWEYAGLFSDGVAAVGRLEEWDLIGGLIHEDGKMLLPMEYNITETTGGFIFSIWDDSAGSYRDQWFYDKASGALFPISYDIVPDWNGGELLIAENDGLYGFIRRETGEVVFPLQFDGLYDDVGCREGYVLAAYERGYQGDGSVWGPDYHLYTLTGEEIVFPFGIKPDSCVHDGVLRIARALTEQERISHPSGWGMVYGLGKPDGTVMAEPQYDYLEFAGDGLVSTYLDGKCGVIGLTGQEIVPHRYQISTGGELPVIVYWHGYAKIDDLGENWRETKRYVIIDTEGNEVFSRFARADSFSLDSLVLENSLIWYKENGLYGLMKITGDSAEYLTEPRYESHIGGVFDTEDLEYQIDFAEGLHPVRINGLWGYINEQAETVILPVWDKASSFRDGLALVEKDGKLVYIDHAGIVVWQETPIVYYNPGGGRYYHTDSCCPRVDPMFWLLSPVSMETINNDKSFSKLLPCSVCGAPERSGADGE
ncbi:MAG: WG repeat-containing protein [Clostridia bacterium]|nr:WG repeat-containing protein [Clostridia bacterium]